MNFMLSDDGKESNTEKGVNIATEFKEYEDTSINRKVLRHKMKRIWSKNHKNVTHEVNDYHHVLMIRGTSLMVAFIRLPIFTKI